MSVKVYNWSNDTTTTDELADEHWEGVSTSLAPQYAREVNRVGDIIESLLSYMGLLR